MMREIGISGFAKKLLDLRKKPEPPPPPVSADAAERRAQMAADRGGVSGGTSRSRMSLDASPASTAPRRPSTRDFEPFVMNQYDGSDKNACGTTSLSMVLNYWKNDPGAYNHNMIDDTVRRGPDMFSSPQNLIDYARDQGFRSEGHNNSSIEDLQKYLDQGVPVQVLIDPDDDGGDDTLHYVNVVDYKTDDDGNITDFVIADPAGGDLEEMSREDFEKRWGDLHLMGADTGIENLMIVTLPGENTPVTTRDGRTINSDDIELPPRAPFWERALGIEFGAGLAIADEFSDLVNEGAELVETAKDVGGTIVDGAARVGSWLNPLD